MRLLVINPSISDSVTALIEAEAPQVLAPSAQGDRRYLGGDACGVLCGGRTAPYRTETTG
ncbi:hypothetical protein [Ramlibacter sp.]|uniref:hypothetical protein n=1 Tax=Ramlibacter sp. TaxID=1917967 RepID=UPI002631822D|nr:hypothetical protein [Ramlibacter sp.]